MKWLRRLALVVMAVTAMIVTVASVAPLPGERATAAGGSRNHALYVAARDGTRIAIDVWLPANLAAGDRIPALIQGSRYWRAMDVSLLGRIMHLFGLDAPGVGPGWFAGYFLERGYAYVTVDVRGTGASFGVHDAEYSLQEIADYRAILDWIVAQPWSNGRIGAVGTSYAGTTAELMTTTGHPALKAAAPLYSDFDAQFHLVMPGGVYQPAFVSRWSKLVSAMDRNDMCGVASAATGDDIRGVACAVTRLFSSGVKPVDGPEGPALLDQAVAQHNSPEVAAMVPTLEFRDSVWSRKGYTAMDNQPFGRRRQIEASGVPLYVVTGWFDAATSDGALARFASFSNPQSVHIGPFSHGGDHDTDPYKPEHATLVWARAEQLARLEAFFAPYLLGQGTTPDDGLSYYVMGADRWLHTEVWPPPGMETQTYRLAAGHRLADDPSLQAGSDRYQVDYGVGTANATRWMTQLDGADVFYPRSSGAEGLLAYQTLPFEQDMELTGTVVLVLWLSTDRDAGAIHAYLEDVAPDGTARYLSEGVLDLKHRRVAPGPPPYPVFGPYHSFLEADTAAMPLHQPERVALGLYATSALIRKGHAIRVAISGADATSFARVPAAGSAPRWSIHRSPGMPSTVALPLRPWHGPS